MMRFASGVLAMSILVAAARLDAQLPRPRPYPEFRADALFGGGTTAQAGAGVAIPLGVYVRLGVDGAAGAMWDHDRTRATERVDAVARFLLDPFREVPVGLSMGGGASLRYVDGDRVRPYLVAVIDVEGRRRGAFTPAVQVGLGGGTRVSLLLRRSFPEWR
jgi:hypothetical protein